jgi:hypothetical protein
MFINGVMGVRWEFGEAVYPLLVWSEGGEVEVDFGEAKDINIVLFDCVGYLVMFFMKLRNGEAINVGKAVAENIFFFARL